MTSKNRTIRNFVTLVPDYVRSKCERYESGIHRCLQVMCCMDNLAVFDLTQPEVIEFFVNVRELLKACDHKSMLGWKTVELVKHLTSEPSLREFLGELDFVPILAQYLHNSVDAEKVVLLLTVLESLTEGVIVDRSGHWLGSLLKYLTNSILEKSDHTLTHLLAVLSNFCLENYIVISELQRNGRSDELLQFLVQLQTTNPLVQLHAAQVVFSLLAIGSISESLLWNYVTTTTELLVIGAKNNNFNLIKRCSSILLWMTRDRLIVEMFQLPKFQNLLQDCLENLMAAIIESQNTSTVDSVLVLTTKLLRTPLISNKKFTENFIPDLIPLLRSSEDFESLLELLADLLKNSSSLKLLDESLEQLFSRVVEQIDSFQSPTSKKSCRTLGYAMQILQKLYKVSPSNSGFTCSLRPETFVRIISQFVALRDESDDKKTETSATIQPVAESRFSPETTTVVIETLTLLGQIACRGGEWLQTYSYLLGEANLQQCLASAILHGESHLKQSTLALVGTLGFSTDSVTALSQALDQLCTIANGGRRASTSDDSASNVQSVNHVLLGAPSTQAQSLKMEKLIQKIQTQEKFWENVKKCEVIELMELQLERREREEHRLRLELDAAQQALNASKISRMQIQAENVRMMSMVLGKTELVEHKEAENRGLARRMEQLQQQLRNAETSWRKERDRLLAEKDKFEKTQTEANNQLQSQLDSAMKQIRNLVQKSEEMDEELKGARKTNETLKAQIEKREKEFEKQDQELQETKTTCETLKKTLRKREKEIEEKDKEVTSLNQMVKKSEMVRQDLEARLMESEKSCQETKEKLTKLEKIQEFIFELSSGKKKLFEEK